MATEWLIPSVVALVGGGAAGMVSTLVRARVDLRKARTDEDRAPVDLGDVAVGAAEKVVSSLVAALEQNERRVQKLERDVVDRDMRIEHLEQDLTRAHARIGRLQTELDRRIPPIS